MTPFLNIGWEGRGISGHAFSHTMGIEKRREPKPLPLSFRVAVQNIRDYFGELWYGDGKRKVVPIMDLSLSEQVMYSTLQIEKLDCNTVVIGYASGFILDFCVDANANTSIPALVTNRHVLSNCDKVRVTFALKKADGTPDMGNLVSAIIDLKNRIFHPDDNIDLAILLIGPTITELSERGTAAFFARLDSSVIPDEHKWSCLTAVEDVTMVGYPRGLRDKVNNLPIFRRGITATHPRFDFDGESMFLVDMACLLGSSGSPVLLLNEGMYTDKRSGTTCFSSRIQLLGVFCAIPNLREAGELIDASSEQTQLKPSMRSYTNLGFVIKSTELLTFEELLRSSIID